MNSKTPPKSSSADVDCFAGVCNKCGEQYEAQSPSDDLEGITFQCKKVICDGRVTLQFSKTATLANAARKTDDNAKEPRRYC